MLDQSTKSPWPNVSSRMVTVAGDRFHLMILTHAQAGSLQLLCFNFERCRRCGWNGCQMDPCSMDGMNGMESMNDMDSMNSME